MHFISNMQIFMEKNALFLQFHHLYNHLDSLFSHELVRKNHRYVLMGLPPNLKMKSRSELRRNGSPTSRNTICAHPSSCALLMAFHSVMSSGCSFIYDFLRNAEYQR